MNTLRFDQLPSMRSSYLRALLPHKTDPNPQLPELRAELQDLRVSADQLQEYHRVCQLSAAQDQLSLTFPHVLAAPLHAELLTHPSMPFPALGLIHIKNSIYQLRPISLHEHLSFAVSFGELTTVEQGHSFEIITEVQASGEEVWRESTVILAKSTVKKTSRRDRPEHQPGIEPNPLCSVTFSVPEDTGRAYAKISGDYNPIHLAAPSAKLFGFPRAIAHGMWTLPRCFGALQELSPLPVSELHVAFKRPVLLPSRVTLSAWRRPGEIAFELRSPDQRTLHLEGSLRSSSPSDEEE